MKTPYYIDESLAKEVARDLNAVAEKFNKVIELYKQITAYKIESMEDLRRLCKNPRLFWKEEFFRKNKKKFGAIAELDEVDIDSLVKTPANFDLIEREISKLQLDTLTIYYTVKDGAVTTTEAINDFIQSKTAYYAETSAEQERLEQALNLIEAFRAMESTIIATSEDKRTAMRGIACKLYIPEMPQLIKRIEESEFTGGFYHAKRVEVYPNPRFVREGFKNGFRPGQPAPERAKLLTHLHDVHYAPVGHG